jgi:hypothetical protein
VLGGLEIFETCASGTESFVWGWGGNESYQYYNQTLKHSYASYTLSQAWKALEIWNFRHRRLDDGFSRACRLSVHVCVRAEARLHLFPKPITENIPSENVNTSGYLSAPSHGRIHCNTNLSRRHSELAGA